MTDLLKTRLETLQSELEHHRRDLENRVGDMITDFTCRTGFRVSLVNVVYDSFEDNITDVSIKLCGPELYAED